MGHVRNSRIRLALAVIGVGALTVAVWMWRQHSQPEDRVYRIGWEPSDPFQIAEPGGEPTGLAIELVREAARRRNIRLQWVDSPQGGERSLRSGAVDLWPLITIFPERRKYFHITAPYIETEVCFLVRKQSSYNRVPDLAHASIRTTNLPPDIRYLNRLLPTARLVTSGPSKELVQDVCHGRTDAAFLDLYAAIHYIFEGGGCESEPLRWIPVTDIRPDLGIGSQERYRAAADAIRDEIGRIVEDGSFSPATVRWVHLSGLPLRQVEQMVRIERRGERLRGTVLAITLLLTAAILLTLRVRSERNRARHAERALRATEQKFRAISESMSEMVLAYDMQARLIYSNPAVERLTGYTSQEVSERGLMHLVHPADSERMREQWQKLFAGDSYSGQEYRLVTKQGEVRWVIAAWGPIRDDAGRQIGVHGCEHDITARKDAEAAREEFAERLALAQKMESIGRLAGGIAHDFNNLLTVINGYSRLMLNGLSLHDPMRTQLEEIHTSGERAAALTRQLLAFSRKQILKPKVVDLNVVVGGMRSMLARLVGEDVTVVFAVCPSPVMAKADPHQLEQVVMNLAANGRDAMPGGGELRIGTRIGSTGDAGLRQAILTVTDSGTGMSEDTRQHIFEPFFTTKELGRGTGLGLSMVQGIVAQSGGSIEVHSAPGVGTEFEIQLPWAEEAPQAEQAPTFANGAGHGSILVVEDQDDVRKFTAVALRCHGYNVIEAAGGRDALLFCGDKSRRIDLIVTDVVMPGMSGPEMVQAAEKLRPGIRSLFTSGYTDDTIVRHGVVHGERQLLHKPFSPEQLAEKVQAMLRS